MITTYRRKKDKIVSQKLESVKKKKNLWVDCYKPSAQEMESLSKFSGIPVWHLKEHTVSYERPTTIEHENFSLIVLGAPVIKKKGADATSLAIFIFKGDNILTLRSEELESIEKFKKELQEKNPKYLDSPTLAIQILMEKLIDIYFEHFETFQETADKIEATLFKNPRKEAVEETFKIRKSILMLHKALVANREVLLSLEKQHLSRIAKKNINDFKDIREDIMQLIDTEDTLRNVLTGVLDIYTSQVSNQMNQVIKKLTVVASYVLIPTLIASIYGMNFRYMPEIPWKWGYPFSLGLMILSILMVYLYFKKAKML